MACAVSMGALPGVSLKVEADQQRVMIRHTKRRGRGFI
jgi:hypothetical protein